MDSVSTLHLPFRDYMHYFKSDQKDPGTAKSLETQHGPRASLGCPMVLLDGSGANRVGESVRVAGAKRTDDLR
jgi:hypothetical protein